ncbi:MAG: cytochrome c family protein [Pseudomonadota bacterium]
MDSFEFNKIAGCILAAALVIFGSRVVVEEVLHRDPPAEPGYKVDVAAIVTSAPSAAKEEAEEVEPIGIRLASADPEAGAKVFRKCAACHSVNEGGANKVGPALWGVVGRQVAALDGFAYSSALQAHGGAWSHEQLDGFLLKPKDWVPGTSMGYAGLKKPADRANLIAYLRDNTPNPPAIEAPAASDAATDGESDDAAGAQDAADATTDAG